MYILITIPYHVENTEDRGLFGKDKFLKGNIKWSLLFFLVLLFTKSASGDHYLVGGVLAKN